MSILFSLSAKDTEMSQSKFVNPGDHEDRNRNNCRLVEDAIDLNSSISFV